MHYTQTSRLNNRTPISHEQSIILNNYFIMYNNTLLEISNLHKSLNEIRNTINTFYFQTNNTTTNANNTRQPYYNRNATPPYIDVRVRNNNTQNLNTLNNFLEPVLIRPTPYQIENSTNIIRFGDIQNPINTTCPITREVFDSNDQVTQIIHCSHIFNSQSIINWFNYNCICPVCRYDIRTNVLDTNIITHTTTTTNTITPQLIQTPPITTNVSSLSQPITTAFQFRDIPNNNGTLQQYIYEYVIDLETTPLLTRRRRRQRHR